MEGNTVESKAERAQQHVSIADTARDFYTTNSGDDRAKDARVLEILSLISAIEGGDKTLSGRLRGAVEQLRQGDIPQQVKSRGVAAYEFTEALRGVGDRRQQLDVTAEVARKMMKEFPAADEGYQALWAVARAEEGDAAVVLSKELLNEQAPEWVRRGAENLIARQKLVGQALSTVLGDDYAEMLAKLPAYEPVVVYTWSVSAPGSTYLGKMLQARRFAAVGICLDEDTEEAAQTAQRAGLGGELIYDAKGALGAVAAKLHFDVPGQVYLTDDQRIIREVHGANLETKFQRLGFETKPITPPEPYNPSSKN